MSLSGTPRSSSREEMVNHSESSMALRSFQALEQGTSWLFKENLDAPLLWRAFFSLPTDLGMGIVVMSNVVMVIQEVDAASLGQEVPLLVDFCNRAFVFVYLSELLLRFYLLRLTMFKDPYTVVDAIVVHIDLTVMLFLEESGFKNTSIVRVFRLAKLARSVHLMEKAPELHLMIKGIFGAVKSILYGSIFACSLMLFWSILAVEFVQPTNHKVAQTGFYDDYGPCNRCARAYKTVWDSFHTFSRIVICGDSWGTFTEAIIEEDPFLMVFFLAVYASINYVVLNMILAVIIDSAQEARSLSVQELAIEKEKFFEKAEKRLIELCEKLDLDGDGMLTMDELNRGFNVGAEFSDILKSLGIKRHDMPVVFGVMDADDSGTVSFQEFVSQLYSMQKNDTQSMLMHLRFYVQQILKSVKNQLDGLDAKLSTKMVEEELKLERKLSDAKTNIVSQVITEEEKSLQEMTSGSYHSGLSAKSLGKGGAMNENNKANPSLNFTEELHSRSHSSHVVEPFRGQIKSNERRSDIVDDFAVKLNDMHISIMKLLSQFETPAPNHHLVIGDEAVRLQTQWLATQGPGREAVRVQPSGVQDGRVRI